MSDEFKPAIPNDRTVYRVWRACRRCKGSGAGVCRPECYVCQGRKGFVSHLYASELTEVEIRAMPRHLQERIQIEILALAARNEAARQAALVSTWEKTHTARFLGKHGEESMTIPESTPTPVSEKKNGKRGGAQMMKHEPSPPTGSSSVRAWQDELDRLSRWESRNSDGLSLACAVMGKRSNGLQGQRLMA